MKVKTILHPVPPGRRIGRKMIATLLATSVAFASISASAAPKDQPKVTDQQITNRVEQVLMADSALQKHALDATTSEGIVTLSGTANHLMAKERAVALAQTIRGVRSVVNTVTLMSSPATDEDIRKKVESALLFDAATDAYEITSRVKDGVVTLEGTVQSYPEQQLAVHVAKGVSGVKGVNENLTIKGKSDRPDSEVAAEVKRIIDIDARLHPNSITVEVKDGVVTLTGAVGSSAQKGRAMMLAATPGVKSVDVDGLNVDPQVRAKGQRKETVTVKGDPQIKAAVKDALVYDPRVFSFNPTVQVENGVVTLTGVVDNLKAKRAAEQDARNTVGVWRVKNLLKVRPSQPIADDKIVQDVESALLRDAVVESSEIDVAVRNGVVTLTGTVDSYFEKARAEDLASRANGVTFVRNYLLVSYPSAVYYSDPYPYGDTTPFNAYWDAHRPPPHSTWPYTSDAEVKDDIEDELFWSPFVGFNQVAVKVENGVATLTGRVDSWSEYNAAVENAYEGGARSVINNLIVDD